MAVCAFVSIPMPWGVPVTLQTFAVFAAVGILGWKRGVLSLLLYLAIGALGAPVFSGFRGGFGVLLGPTGGYLWGFIPALLLCGLLMPLFGKRFFGLLACMGAGLLVCYTAGTIWFVCFSQSPTTFGGALLGCVVPFIAPDAAKLALAAFLSLRCRSLLK